MQRSRPIWHLWLLCAAYPPMILSESPSIDAVGVHLPITYRRGIASLHRRSDASQIAVGGLGDYEDV